MDTNQALLSYLTTRRSVPAVQLGAPGPDRTTLQTMLTIAARVPDHGKLAPWRFIVFEGDARTAAGERLARIVARRDGVDDPERLALERDRFRRAPLVVAVVSRATAHPKIPEWEQVLSSACAALNLVHAAAAYGFATQWITEWYAYDEEAKSALGIAAHENVTGFVHIGTSDEQPADRTRPDVVSLVTYFA